MKMYKRISNRCAICGAKLTPFTQNSFTAHEFRCYKAAPERIPERDKEKFNAILSEEKRRKETLEITEEMT